MPTTTLLALAQQSAVPPALLDPLMWLTLIASVVTLGAIVHLV